MNALWRQVRVGVLSLPVEETGFSRRGFRGATGEMRQRLEQIGAEFIRGYQAALERGNSDGLSADLEAVDIELRGFAFEGAAMGLALLDSLTPWRANRLANFLQGAGDAHTYMVHVGVGWVWARVPFDRRRAARRLDPLLHWLAYDGWGFHEGFFHWREYIAGREWPRQLDANERRVFDQGLGRSFWFVNGGNPKLIASTIHGLPASRRADLWSGIGLAATYAGIVDEAALHTLQASAGEYRPHLAQGSAFAAKARQRAGNLTAYTSLATGVLCEMSALDAARLSDTTLENLSASTDPPAYEIWRQRLRNHFQTKPTLQEA